MKVNVTREEIAKDVNLTCITDGKFKTNSAVIRFIMPLDESTASANALAAQLLLLSHKKYTGLTEITDFTNKLYGASVGVSNFKVGDNQVIAFTANSIRDEYALEGERLFYELIKVLLECIFDPLEFDSKYFELKKRELINSIDSEINEKRTYAILNANKYAFKDEPYSLSPLYVMDVAPGSDAEAQGIRVGDIVTAINGEGVRQTSDVAAIISQYDVGTIMTFTIYRDGETLQVDVTLMETSDIY